MLCPVTEGPPTCMWSATIVKAAKREKNSSEGRAHMKLQVEMGMNALGIQREKYQVVMPIIIHHERH